MRDQTTDATGESKMKTATIRFEPAYFNSVCYANIPESWTVFPDNGRPKLKCDSVEDAREVAASFGYEITCV